MKILLAADTAGTVWTHSLELARALHAKGISVALAATGSRLSADQRAEARRLPGVELLDGSHAVEWTGEPREDIRRTGEWLLSMEQQTRPHLVQLNGALHASLPWSAPVVVTMHSCRLSRKEALGEATDAADEHYFRKVAAGLRAAEMVIAPSATLLRNLNRHYGPLRQARAVPYGRDPRLFSPVEKEPLVVTTGPLSDRRRNGAAVTAVAGRLPWPVYVSGESEQELPGGARGIGVAQLSSWLGRASIYAAPACYEPFGMPALEAGMAECALVLGDVPSLRETWGEAPLYVSPDDPEALLEAIGYLIDNPEERVERAFAARARALDYTPERLAAGYASVYRYLTLSRVVEPAGIAVGADAE